MALPVRNEPLSDAPKSGPTLADLASLFDAAPFGIFAIARDGTIAYVNSRQCENSRLSREFFLGRPYRSTFAATLEGSGMLADYDRLVATGHGFERTIGDYRRLADGAPMALTMRGYRSGEWTLLVTTVDTALSNQIRHYAQLFENANDGVFILSRAGRFLKANRKFGEMVGVPADALIGQTTEVFLPGQFPESLKRIELILAGGSLGPYELRIATPLGPKNLSLNGFALVEDGRPTGVINIARDVTEDRDRAEELRFARDQALASSRLKTVFLANMSHEIRTPLNVILGCSSLVGDFLDQQAPKQDIVELLDNVQRAGKRLQETIEAILDVSRIEAGAFDVEPEAVEVGELVERKVEEFRPLAESRGLSISAVIEEPDAVVRFDAYCLRQALSNLISNAVKFTPDGSIRVELGRDAERGLVVRVRDTGIGMDPGFVAELGQLFHQEDSGFSRRYDGCGLGLALTRRYLDLNGARLSVSSEKGEGSVFTIHFDGERHEISPGRSSFLPRAVGEPASVLVVEDDLETQKYMGVLLGSRFEVSLAATAKDALQVLSTRRVDLVLMDISLRGGDDGLALTKMLRRDSKWSHLPIIAVTAHAFPENRQEALAAGCDDFLVKPFEARQLMALMGDLLERGPAPADGL